MLRHHVPIMTFPFPTLRPRRRVLPRYQSDEMKRLNILFPRMGIESITVTRLCPCTNIYTFSYIEESLKVLLSYVYSIILKYVRAKKKRICYPNYENWLNCLLYSIIIEQR